MHGDANQILKRIIMVLVLILIGTGCQMSNIEKNVSSDQTESEQTLIKAANQIVDNKIPIRINNETNHFEYDGDFLEYSDELRSTQRLIYSFNYLNDLGRAYELTNDQIYINKGMQLIQDFSDQASFDKAIDNGHMSWHDETTARRLRNYLIFLEKGSDYLSSSEKDFLFKETKFIAEQIAYTDFYSGSNNHGLFQDESLIAYALMFSDKEKQIIASERIQNYFFDHFGPDGVHLENSPEYHFGLVNVLRNVLNNYSEAELSSYNKLVRLYENTINFSKMVTLPTGNIPNIGDTKTMNIDLSDYYEDELINESPNYERYSFMYSGYDIYKSGNNYLLLRAGYHKDYHHHNDDLSFWLYKDGNIFTEFGSFGYENSNPHAEYQKSFEAHNTLIVDDKNVTETRDVNLLDSNQENVMSGETNRIVGLNFKRAIHFNKELTEIIIDDQITSLDGETHDYELLFHLDSSITPKIINENSTSLVELYRNNTLIGSFKTTEELILKDDYYYPYYYADPEETKVISIQTNGIDKNIQTTINLAP